MGVVSSALRGCALLVVFCGGCASTSSLLVKRFGREHSCEESRVLVIASSANAYAADGCGQHVEYICESFAGMNADAGRCVERGILPRSDQPRSSYRDRPELEPPK
jgi:hypothetical protein